MATNLKNLSDPGTAEIPSAKGFRYGIVVAEWNAEITEALYKGAYETLLKYGATDDEIIRKDVPGSYELTLGAQYMAEYGKIDAVICLGCVIQGETRHFDFICDAVAHGLTMVSMRYNKPVIFGVLTTNDVQQARERSGGKHGNKGDEAAITAIKMLALRESFKNEGKKKVGFGH